MDSAPLLAITALGLVAVYLMLPRQRVGLVRLGALVGVLTLAGFFLYLVRQGAGPVETAGGGGGGGGPSIYFYLFASIMIGGSVGVICHPRPVYAALYFVLVTLAGAALFVLLMAEFLAVVLIIVYAGAILVTYVFVIMLASQGRKSPEYDRIAAEPFVAVLVSFVLLGAVLQVMFPGTDQIIALSAHADPMMAALTQPATQAAMTATTAPAYTPGNIQVLGLALYGHYALSLEIAGILLTIALVGAVVIARKNAHLDALGSGGVPNE